jgi:hypothetical protein
MKRFNTLLLGILFALLAHACQSNGYKSYRLHVLEAFVDDGEIKISQDRESLDWGISGKAFSLEPIGGVGRGIGVWITPKTRFSFVLSGIQLRYSDISAGDAMNANPMLLSEFSNYYYKLRDTKENGIFTSPVIVDSKCELGYLDVEMRDIPKYVVFDLGIELNSIRHTIKMITKRGNRE